MRFLLSLGSHDPKRTVALGVIARVKQLLEFDGTDVGKPWSWSGAVPISTHDFKELMVERPGLYLLEVVLPSGEILTKQKTIAKGETVEARFQLDAPKPVPRAERGQRNLPPRQKVSGPRRGDEYILHGAPTPQKPHKITKVAQGDDEILLMRASRRRGSTWSDLLELSRYFGVLPSKAQKAIEKSFEEVVVGEGLQAVPSSAGEAWLVQGAVADPGQRIFAAVRSHSKTNFASLPHTWRSADAAKHSVIEIQTHDNSEFCASVVIHDAMLDGLLAYLGTGKLREAATMLNAVCDGPWETRLKADTNPLMATIAAYVSSGTDADGSGSAELRSLAWAPDGTILEARQRLRNAKSDEDFEAARSGFVKAYTLGLPYFSAGVQFLADGLATFASEDVDIERMSLDVSAARARIDPFQVFSVFKLGKEA
ncbi:hypothetical protein GFL92_01025 [Rhizobium leguminosarum bv. viciae]|nr:hypothetical protein [Rhizobium leguminosarum bv. viciae]